MGDDDDEHENGFLAAKQKHNEAATTLSLTKYKARVVESLLKQASGDFTRVGYTTNDVRLQTELENIEIETSYQILQTRLIAHFKYQYSDGKIQWLKYLCINQNYSLVFKNSLNSFKAFAFSMSSVSNS